MKNPLVWLGDWVINSERRYRNIKTILNLIIIACVSVVLISLSLMVY